jgi:hypothetical protein
MGGNIVLKIVEKQKGYLFILEVVKKYEKDNV